MTLLRTIVFAGLLSTSAFANEDALRVCLISQSDPDAASVLRATVRDCANALSDLSLGKADRVEALTHRGVALRNLRELQASLRDLEEAVRLAPDNAFAIRMYAWTLREMRRLDEAEAEYDHALSIKREWQGLLSRCVVRIDREDYVAALLDCEEALTLHPNEDAYYFTAWLFHRKSETARAIGLLEEARASRNASPRIYQLLALSYQANSSDEDALRIIKEGLKAFPRDASLKEFEVQLRN
ncbi:hypothetical protein BH10PSE7_BH10PSE7_14200 [soil metagenome]